VAFAGLNLLACLPLHYRIARSRKSEAALAVHHGREAVASDGTA